MADTMMQRRPLTNFYRRDLPDTCVSFVSKEGREIFAQALASGHMETYFSLAAQFRTQDEPNFCGLSTLVMTLNALEVDPKRIWKGPWRWYHENMLDCCSPLENVKKNGITLDQFTCLAACNMLNVDTKRATEHTTEHDFRDTVSNVTRFTHEVLALSYFRPILGQTGGGHFSPLAGYHPTKDLLLILDTARFKYPPYWVPLPLMWTAMQQHDKETGRPRGYSVLSRKDTKPLLVFRLSDLLDIPLQEWDSAHTGIHQFVETWNSWLTTESQDLSKDDFFIDVLRGLCKSIDKLNPKKAILSTQVDCRGENGNLEEHMRRAKEIVKTLASFDIFETIQLSLARDAGLFQMCKLVCNTSEQSSAEKCFTQICCGSDTVCHVTDKLGLEPAHFITLLLLAWPYDIHVLPSNANGYILQSFMSDAIASQTDAIKNETENVRDQLRGVLMYIKDHTNLAI